MDWVWAFIGGAAVGFAICWYATWYRLARVESDVRHVANEAAEYERFEGTTIPAEWIRDQVEWLLNRNFR